MNEKLDSETNQASSNGNQNPTDGSNGGSGSSSGQSGGPAGSNLASPTVGVDGSGLQIGLETGLGMKNFSAYEAKKKKFGCFRRWFGSRFECWFIGSKYSSFKSNN